MLPPLFAVHVVSVVPVLPFHLTVTVSLLLKQPPPLDTVTLVPTAPELGDRVRVHAAATYVGEGPGVGVVLGVGWGVTVTAPPSAFNTLMRPKLSPAMGSVAPTIWL
jgi:hypothetical protein